MRLEKRSQTERLSIAESLLSEVCHELQQGIMPRYHENAQLAVECQALINKIVFIYNRERNGKSN